MGKMIDFPSNGHSASGYLAAAPKGGPGLVVIQEWWGLNDNIKQIADSFAEAGFWALAPDLYHGEVTAAPDEARRLAMQLNLNQAAKDMSGAVDAVRIHSGGLVGAVGYCLGGGLALALAALRPDAVAAVAPYYGIPRMAQLDWPGMKAAVQGHYGEQDTGIPLEEVHKLELALKTAGKEVHIHLYPAGHAFANSGGRNYHPESALLAWERTVAFFREKLVKQN
jgi:carboxymethylenebutenolidase